MTRSTHESPDDSDNDEPATYASSLAAVKSDRSQHTEEDDSVNKMGGADTIAEEDATHAEPDANEHLGSRSDASESERTPGAGCHNIATLGDDVNLLDYVREHNTTLTFPEKVSTDCEPTSVV
jgi:hypothetical protein